MNTDDFEQQLRGQPMRTIPAEWRREILGNVQGADVPHSSSPSSQLILWCRTLLWPYPQAWAGLAAVWVLILGLHLIAGFEPRQTSRFAAVAPSPEWRALLAEQQRLFTELVASPPAMPVRHPAAPIDRPRSQRISPAGFSTTQWLELPCTDCLA